MTPEWTKDALCLNMDTNLFFDTYENNDDVAVGVDIMCSRCPVRRRCFSYGVSNKETGVWGGVYFQNGLISSEFNRHKQDQDWADIWVSLTVDGG